MQLLDGNCFHGWQNNCGNPAITLNAITTQQSALKGNNMFLTQTKENVLLLKEWGMGICRVDVFFYVVMQWIKSQFAVLRGISNIMVCDACVFHAAVFSKMKLFAVLWFLVWLGDVVFVNFFWGVAVFRPPHVPLLKQHLLELVVGLSYAKFLLAHEMNFLLLIYCQWRSYVQCITWNA